MSTITALLLQLIQASALGTASKVKKLRATAVDVEAGGKQGQKEDASLAVGRLPFTA